MKFGHLFAKTFLFLSILVSENAIAAPSTPQNVEVSSDSSRFVLIHGEVPFLVPVDPNDDDGKFSVTWDAVSGIEYYEYRVCEAGVCGEWEWSDVTSVGVQVNNSGDFTVEVRACDSSGCSGSSESESIYVSDAASAGRNTMTLSTIPNSLESSDSVGAVGGQFRVNESGQATYSIPIFTPKGIAGIQPQIALTYNSQGGTGALGVGWGINGLSAITRCRQTKDTDGINKEISLSLDDRFCLDGQRLILASGSYGASGSTYRTEIASQTKVVARGVAGNGPEYFEVYRKDGSKSTYGRTDNSRLMANNVSKLESGTPTLSLSGTVSKWAQSDYTDNPNLISPNKISYTYDENEAFGESYISKITYSPNVEVKFNYAYSYKKGGISSTGYFRNSKKLVSIIVSDNYNQIRKYELDYKTKEVVFNDEFEDSSFEPVTYIQDDYPLRITEITESAKASDGTWVSKQPTSFNWTENRSGFNQGASTTGLGSTAVLGPLEYGHKIHEGNFQFGDVNGDDFQDIVFASKDINDSKIKIYTGLSKGYDGYNSGDNFDIKACVKSLELPPSDNEAFTWSLLDWNADGKLDLYTTSYVSSNNYKLNIYPGNSNGCFGSTSLISGFYSNTYKTGKPQDYNADGLPDIIASNKVYFAVKSNDLSKPYSWGGPRNTYLTGPSVPSGNDTPIWNYSTKLDFSDLKVSDFNGDGKADITVKYTLTKQCKEREICGTQKTTTTDRYIATSIGDGGFRVLSVLTNYGVRKDSKGRYIEQFVDLNGDGLTDYLYKRSSDNYWYYRLSNSKYLLSPIKLTQLGTSASPTFTDYNADGRVDIAYTKSSKLWVSPGSEYGFTSPINTGVTVGSGNRTSVFLDVTGDGVQEHIRVDMESNENSFRLDRPKQAKNQKPYLIDEIQNGLGNITKVNYKPLTYSDLYTKATNSKSLFWGASSNCKWGNYSQRNSCAPVFDYNTSMYVVSSAKSTSPIVSNKSAYASISYKYGKARVQSNGRGFLGFEWLETKDEQTGITTRTTYKQDFPFTGRPESTVTKYNGKKLNESISIWGSKLITLSSGNKIRFPYTLRTSDTKWNLNTDGSVEFSSESLTQMEYDNYGNVTKSVTAQSSSRVYNDYVGLLDIESVPTLTKVITVNTYDDRPQEWRLGRLVNSKVTHKRKDQTDITRESAFEYDSVTGFIKKEIVEPNSSSVNEKLTTVYVYDKYGNIKRKRTYSPNPGGCSSTTSLGTDCEYYINRWTDTVYDSNGRYVTKTKNSFGQATQTILSRNILGQVTKSRSLSGVTTLNGYGAFGHEYFTFNSAGNWSKETKFLCSSNCPTVAVYGVKSETATGGKSFAYFDALGRTVQKASISFDGDYSVTSTDYNKRGLAIKGTEPKLRSMPYNSVTDAHFSTTEYDVLGRPTVITNPDQGRTLLNYDGNSVTTTNPLNQIKTEVKDSSGKTIRVIDNLNNSLYYSYNATGDLLTLKFGSELQSEMTYDSLGRKTSMWDADKGGANGKSWSYSYNALGEIVEQTDAKDQKVITYRDRLGRTVKRLDINASGAITADQRWSYNNKASLTEYGYDVGKLTKEIDHVSGYEVNYNYDDIGRLDQTLTYIDEELFVTETIFDSYGRVLKQYDAASSEFANAGIQNVYNQYGFLKSVHEAAGSPKPSNRLRLIEEMDERGNVTLETKGANSQTTREYYPDTGRLKTISTEANNQQVQLLEYYWDAIGNLKRRETKDTVSNSMIHENFTYDGLNRLINANHPNEDMDISYYSNGNIQTKSGVGTYTYGETCNGVKAGPHAVTQAGNNSYCYDENGNMLSGDGRNMSYSTFDKMVRVDKGGHTTKFAYAPSRSRYKRIDIADGKTTTTFYVGNVEIIKHSDKSYTTYRRNLGGAIIEEATDGTKKTSYLHTDHLGSTDVITNASGTLVQQFSFNAFGERRDPVNWETYIGNGFLSISPMSASLTLRGYTGHEQMDEVGLVHMNGRVYDPKLGRFLQADPHIQAPSDSQNLNRYSYVNNNPLSYTDPTGYFFKKLWDEIRPFVGIIVAVVLTAYCGPCGTGAYKAFVVGAAAGAASAAANGGNVLRGAVIGAISALAFYGAGEYWGHDVVSWESVGTHAFLGGVMSYLQGGKFGHGFVSAGVTKSFSGKINGLKTTGERTIAAAIIGGTTSKISGGKFANGAISASFSRLFNDEFRREKVKEVKTAAPGEPEEVFMDALGEELDRLTEENEVEYCANICKRTDSFGNEYFSAEVMTDNDPLSCGVATNSCADGYSPAKKAMHSHPSRYRITRELRSKYPQHAWPSRRRDGGATPNEFSNEDLGFVKSTGYDLYLSGGSGAANAMLPGAATSLDEAIYDN